MLENSGNMANSINVFSMAPNTSQCSHSQLLLNM